jgi:hypothetical protein
MAFDRHRDGDHGAGHHIAQLRSRAPVYRFAGIVKLATAAISVATVVALVPLVPAALSLRSTVGPMPGRPVSEAKNGSRREGRI